MKYTMRKCGVKMAHFVIKSFPFTRENLKLLNQKAKALGYKGYRDYLEKSMLDLETQLEEMYEEEFEGAFDEKDDYWND